MGRYTDKKNIAKVGNNNMHEDLVSFREELAQKFPGLRYTSGFRPGAQTKSGNPSRHGKGEAWDVEDNPEVFEYLNNTKEGLGLLTRYGLGILDETSPEVMKRTGATGKHFHIGKDSTLVPNTQRRYSEFVKKIPTGTVVEKKEFNNVDKLVNEHIERKSTEFAKAVPKVIPKVVEAKEEVTQVSREVEFKNKIGDILKSRFNTPEQKVAAVQEQPENLNNLIVPENEFLSGFLNSKFSRGGTVDPEDIKKDNISGVSRDFLPIKEKPNLDFLELALQKRAEDEKSTVKDATKN